jgi:hypothetical protein
MAGQAGRLTAAAVAGALLVAAGPATPDPVAALAGRYSAHFKNGTVDGSTYWSDDVVEVVPVDTHHAYIRVETNFYNGHSCAVAGVAEAVDSTLIYREPAPVDEYNAKCVLTLRRRGKDLSFTDNDGGCQHHCGARGGFRDATLPWASKRPITYLPRLRSSSTYRDALIEWRTGKPVS